MFLPSGRGFQNLIQTNQETCRHMEFNLTGHLGVEFRIGVVRAETQEHLLKVEVAGQYETTTGPILTMIVAAALHNPFGPGGGMIFDLSNLRYAGGDELLDWVYLAQEEDQDYPVAIVTSGQNNRHVSNLIADQQLKALDGLLHRSVSAAQAALEKYSRGR